MNVGKTLATAALLIGAAVSQASDIQVTARNENYSREGDLAHRLDLSFWTTYGNEELPAGSTVHQIINQRCEGQNAWQGFRATLPMRATEANTWSANFTATVYDFGQNPANAPYCGRLEFYFEIKLPDGRTIIDQGGQHPDYYWVESKPEYRDSMKLPLHIDRGQH